LRIGKTPSFPRNTTLITRSYSLQPSHYSDWAISTFFGGAFRAENERCLKRCQAAWHSRHTESDISKM